MRRVFNIDFENAFTHIVLFSIFAWLTAGYFRGIVFAGAANAVDQVLSIIPTGDDPDTSPMAKVRAESGEHPVVLPDNKTVVEHLNMPEPADDDAQARTSVRAEQSTQQDESKANEKTPFTWANIDNSLVPGFTLGAVEIGVILDGVA